MNFHNKKIILIIVAIIIIVSIGIYAAMFSDSHNRVENFQGIQVTVPSISNFIVTDPDGGYDTYEDSTNGIIIIPLKGREAVYSQVIYFNTSGDRIPINISGLPNGSATFKTPQGNIEAIIVNDDVTEGIVIGAPGVDFIKNMAESVVFSNGDKSIDNKQNQYIITYILETCNCTISVNTKQ